MDKDLTVQTSTPGDVITTIVLDECGYTGEDLTNREQPVFVIATHLLSEEQCQKMKAEFFPNFTGTELKHSRLQGKRRNEEAILALLKVVLSPASVRLIAVHKRYAVILK